MARWTFVRHGESVANAERWLAGHVDAPLTDRGQEQARARAAEVQALGVGRCFTSDLQRAWRTARLLLGDQPVHVVQSPLLRERFLGEWEGASWDLLDAGDPLLTSWRVGPPGGEAPRQVVLRYCTFLANQDERIPTLIVGHGLALRSLVGLLDGDPEGALHSVWGNVHAEHRDVAPGTWGRLRDALQAGR